MPEPEIIKSKNVPLGEGSVIPEAAKVAQPMIEGPPPEIGGDKVRQEAATAEAERQAAIDARDETSVGASTVTGKAPGTRPMNGPISPGQPPVQAPSA